MFKIIIVATFLMTGNRGYIEGQDRFDAMEACDAARPDMVEGPARVLMMRHGPAHFESRCVPAAVPAAPDYPA